MLLKVGSRGADVKALQNFLNIESDGIFGKVTEIAVMSWQSNNQLSVDGIVGPITWNTMGLLTTDVTDNLPKLEILDIKTQFLPKGEYLSGPTKKEWLFLHHTAGWNNPYNTISNWGRDTRGAIATEFVLGGQKITDGDSTWDGELVQAFPTGGYGWHLGTGNNTMHRNSVGIEVNNFGYVTKGGFRKNRQWVAGDPNKLYTYVGTVANESQIVTLAKPFRGHTTWHRYSDAQLSVLKELILFIADRDNIDVRKGLPKLIKTQGVDAFDFFDVAHVTKNPGLWNHTNVRKDKVDMFPQPELIDMLLGL
jgi:hypothetical protein